MKISKEQNSVKKQREYWLLRSSEGIMLPYIPGISRYIRTKKKFLLKLIIQTFWLPLWAVLVECGSRSQIVEVDESMRSKDKIVSIDYISKTCLKWRGRGRALYQDFESREGYSFLFLLLFLSPRESNSCMFIDKMEGISWGEGELENGESWGYWWCSFRRNTMVLV